MAQRSNTDTGKPAGAGKSSDGTGIPTVVNDDNMQNDERLSQDYTNDEEGLRDGIREMHPNRNVNKIDTGDH